MRWTFIYRIEMDFLKIPYGFSNLTQGLTHNLLHIGVGIGLISKGVLLSQKKNTFQQNLD